MENLTKITYNIGKFWLAIVLFIAMIISTIVSLPFVLIGKAMDMWHTHKLGTSKNPISDLYG
ncbi:hypothetical protein [Dyadobacter sp. CY312]|uniref:hypothetical protein n=1 Tax=Dyadobacter sp. CY312 TaxID=2907303 RepID=UPI001F1A39AC|nr:hypothetical protein [Dyadobacter sp. CY312]MCE7040832.1 hypothetical protein [Dyadobacter sp. CY312]